MRNHVKRYLKLFNADKKSLADMGISEVTVSQFKFHCKQRNRNLKSDLLEIEDTHGVTVYPAGKKRRNDSKSDRKSNAQAKPFPKRRRTAIRKERLLSDNDDSGNFRAAVEQAFENMPSGRRFLYNPIDTSVNSDISR